jgi:hypothetical protein
VSAQYSKLCHSRDEECDVINSFTVTPKMDRFREEGKIYAEVADENNNGREIKYEIN